MILSDLEFSEKYYRFIYIIAHLEGKLSEVELKFIADNPDISAKEKHRMFQEKYSEQFKVIDNMENLQTAFYKMHKFCQVIDQQNFRISKQFHIMDEKIKSLEKEVEKLNKEKEF